MRKTGLPATIDVDQNGIVERRPMKNIVSQFIPQMTHDEKVELLSDLKSALAEEMAGKAKETPERCPRCGCPTFTRKGRGRDGAQRWLCHGCGHTFSAKTMGLLARSKLDAAAWMAFAECMADNLSLREAAKRCGVSLYTSWFMRMRVCEVMSRRLEPARAGTFHVDGTLVRESLSGDHRQSPWFEMPRKPHRNGQDARRRAHGRSKRSFCVVCGINELGDCFCAMGARGTEGAGELGLLLMDNVPEGSTVATDGHLSYPGALRGVCQHVAVDPHDPSTGNINMVNALHSRLKGFLYAMRGVSARRLQRYLDWFCYREQFRKSDADRRELLFEHEVEGKYLRTRRLTHLEAHPEYEWWVRQRSTVV